MSKVEIFHNPKCSKSRKSLEILETEYSELELSIYDYKEKGLTVDQITRLEELLSKPVQEFLRTKEALYKELAVDWSDQTSAKKALSDNPSLLERPIIVFGDSAVIGRPPENIYDLIKK